MEEETLFQAAVRCRTSVILLAPRTWKPAVCNSVVLSLFSVPILMQVLAGVHTDLFCEYLCCFFSSVPCNVPCLQCLVYVKL